MKKDEIRRIYKLIRLNIEDREEKEIKILNKLLPYVKNAKTVFCYESIKGEVSTKEIISTLSISAQIFVPEVLGNGIMQAIALDDNKTVADTCDITIVPIIAFDETLNRIGFGGGYYDRFLAKGQTLSIGIAFDEQQCEIFEKDTFDYPLDIIITPTRILKII
ncbi:MAG: hypothetical protein IKM44_05385 [Clostridia bacterium]|nr:hypothetical protein [Clostridia bacterium]